MSMPRAQPHEVAKPVRIICCFKKLKASFPPLDVHSLTVHSFEMTLEGADRQLCDAVSQALSFEELLSWLPLLTFLSCVPESSRQQPAYASFGIQNLTNGTLPFGTLPRNSGLFRKYRSQEL